ncbi:hypothetical protein [Streptomyces sp. NBC_00347]|uniref:hypothetical protein n=1 Tax=Streptomyces sp. NBC_00347 TaxID=2975721 RepID=UPI00225B3581|nr:hypothetical protein [Streptomyces sp. NBC_00347]MCX5129295.1 hypothetical protein [Streptomyces sp. NBC_00347]
MPTTVVGFRLGKTATGRQVTVLITESGVLHRSHGVYGQPPKLDAPKLPLRYLRPDLPWMQGEHVLTGPISALRGHHATAVQNGYDKVHEQAGAGAHGVGSRLSWVPGRVITVARAVLVWWRSSGPSTVW